MTRRFAILLACLVTTGPPVARASEAMVDPACLRAPYRSDTSGHLAKLRDLVADLPAILAGFPSLRQAFEGAAPEICLSGNLVEEKGYLDAEANRIVLDADMPRALMAVVLVHEIRHLAQFVAGICPSDTLAMRDYARATFALEADAMVAVLLVAWNRKDAGDPGMWQALAAWPMVEDIPRRFAASMAADGDPAIAAAEAFDQWYGSEARREAYYIASCSGYLDRQDLSHALPSYDALPADYLTHLCDLPDGTRYDCKEAADALPR